MLYRLLYHRFFVRKYLVEFRASFPCN